MESVEWLYLWLTCALDNPLARMPVQQTAIDSGLVKPMFRWSAMAIADGHDLAHLSFRPSHQDDRSETDQT